MSTVSANRAPVKNFTCKMNYFGYQPETMTQVNVLFNGSVLLFILVAYAKSLVFLIKIWFARLLVTMLTNNQ